MAYQFQREDRFAVIKLTDLGKYCTKQQQDDLSNLLQEIVKGRRRAGKLINKYIVVNQDEHYAEEVWRLIQIGEVTQKVAEKLSDEPALSKAFEKLIH